MDTEDKAGAKAVHKRALWGRFDRDESGRWILRMKTVQVVASTVISVGTVFTLLMTAVGVFARPYLEDISRSVVKEETSGIMLVLEQIPATYETRTEHEREMLELNRKLDFIAGEIRRIDDRLLTQSARTDALYRDLMQAVRESRR